LAGRWQGRLPAGCRHAAGIAVGIAAVISGWAEAPGCVSRSASKSHGFRVAVADESLDGRGDSGGVLGADGLQWRGGESLAESGEFHGKFESGDEFHAALFVAVDGGEQIMNDLMQAMDFSGVFPQCG